MTLTSQWYASPNLPVSCTISCPLCQKTLPVFPVFFFLACCYWNADIERSPFFLACYLYAFLSMGFTIPPGITGPSMQTNGIEEASVLFQIWFRGFHFLLLIPFCSICIQSVSIWSLFDNDFYDKNLRCLHLTVLLHLNAAFLNKGKIFQDYATIFLFLWNLHCQTTSMWLTYVFTDC